MKAIFFSILLVTTLLVITQAGYAETFRWVDEYGKIRIGIKPSAEPENTKKDNKEGAAEIKKASPAIAKPVIPKTIVEHATPSAKTIKKPQAVTPAPTPTPTLIVTTPEIIAPTQTPVSIQSPKPVQKTSVEKPKPIKQKTPVKKRVVKKAPAGKKPEKVISVKKKTVEKKSTNERNEEMCGVFTSYVNDYKEKVRDCSENLCDIYKRALARYKKKQSSYCK
ncbi:hypothetical protein MNBD_GAMMA19-1370 [hydrothermal vent metagenome]|uniref:DUF4124 domain-containing protein n=1 Tax=hydrothermal vent metagenome TaxID=652676 RepID=A0A3B1AN06_9ZZZZ